MLKNSLLLSVSVLLCLVITEILFRYFHLFNQSIYWYKPDPQIYYRPMPNSSFWIFRENDHPIEGMFNKWGWRDKNWELTKSSIRIAIIGDSFVQALQVEEDSTFVRLVERNLFVNYKQKVELMNFGRGGFSPTEYLTVLKNDVLQFDPDIVVISYWPKNDFIDVSPVIATDIPRSFYVLKSDGQLELDNSYINGFGYKIASLISNSPIRSVFFLFLTKRTRNLVKRFTIRQRNLIKEKNIPSIPPYLSMWTENQHPEYNDAFEFSLRLLTEAINICKSDGIKFLLLALNDYNYLPEKSSKWQEIDSTFNYLRVEHKLKTFAEVQGVFFLGLQEKFREHHIEHNEPLHWAHYNYAGHRLVARLLSIKLSEIIDVEFNEQ